MCERSCGEGSIFGAIFYIGASWVDAKGYGGAGAIFKEAQDEAEAGAGFYTDTDVDGGMHVLYGDRSIYKEACIHGEGFKREEASEGAFAVLGSGAS